jgi:tetratricopeptide (TPR) repeat protein
MEYMEFHEQLDTAAEYNRTGVNYFSQNKYDEALELFGRALVIREDILGKEHPDTITSYNNVACVFEAQGEYELALELFHETLAFYEKYLGREHPTTITVYKKIVEINGKICEDSK